MHDELLLTLPRPTRLGEEWEAMVDRWRQPSAVGRRGARWFGAAMAFIALVSLWDGYLVWLYDNCIYYTELNPICTYLIKLNRYDVNLLLLCKTMSTALVLLILCGLYSRTPRLAFPVVNCVALFQFLLLVFLHGADFVL